jgi:hypothetical protein
MGLTLIVRVSPGQIGLPVLLVLLTTAFLFVRLGPHARTSILLGFRVDYLSLLSALTIFGLSLLEIPPLRSIDQCVSLLMAAGMIILGLKTAKIWGSILLCMPSRDEKPLIKQVATLVSLVDVRSQPLTVSRMYRSTGYFDQHISRVLLCLIFE